MSTIENAIARSIKILYNIYGDENEIGMDNEQLYNNIQSHKNNTRERKESDENYQDIRFREIHL